MKIRILFLLLISTPFFAQYKINYEDFQSKFAQKYTAKTDSFYDQFTIVEDSIKITFAFSKTEHKLCTVLFYKASGISIKEINGFEEAYIDNFKPTRIKRTLKISVYYDELQELMKFKVYQNDDPDINHTVAYTIDRHDIDPFIVLMDKDKVKSTLKR